MPCAELMTVIIKNLSLSLIPYHHWSTWNPITASPDQNYCKMKLLVWFPVHIGIVGNEKADTTAKAGLNLNSITESISLSPTEVYSIIKLHCKNKCQTLPNVNLQNIKHIEKLVGLNWPLKYSNNAKIDKTITRLRLGTSLLPVSAGQYIIKDLNPNCPQYRVRYHILLSDSLFQAH